MGPMVMRNKRKFSFFLYSFQRFYRKLYSFFFDKYNVIYDFRDPSYLKYSQRCPNQSPNIRKINDDFISFCLPKIPAKCIQFCKQIFLFWFFQFFQSSDQQIMSHLSLFEKSLSLYQSMLMLCSTQKYSKIQILNK
jgi:hypothetical protein